MSMKFPARRYKISLNFALKWMCFKEIIYVFWISKHTIKNKKICANKLSKMVKKYLWAMIYSIKINNQNVTVYSPCGFGTGGTIFFVFTRRKYKCIRRIPVIGIGHVDSEIRMKTWKFSLQYLLLKLLKN